MNKTEESAVLTELTEYSCTQRPELYHKLQFLQKQNTQYKRKWQVLDMLNSTLKQALLNISQKSRLDPRLLQQIRQLSSQASQQVSSCNIDDLKQFYEYEIQKIKQKHARQIQQIRYQFKQQLSTIERQLERQYRQKTTRERQQMLRQFDKCLAQERNSMATHKENRRDKENNTKSSRKKKSSSSSLKNKIIDSPNSTLQSSYGKGKLKIDPQLEQSLLKSRKKQTSTKLYCNDCGKMICSKQLTTHSLSCSRIQYYESRLQHNDNDFGKKAMLEGLILRKKEIECQLERLMSQNDRQSQKVLKTDLDEIIYIINNNSDLSVTEIEGLLCDSKPYSNIHRDKEIIVKRFK